VETVLMAKRLYPAVLERGEHEVLGVWFPDFPGCVAGGKDQDEALGRAQVALERAVEALVERGLPLPQPTAFDAVRIPRGCQVVTLMALPVTPPELSERVNVYLPKRLIERVDSLADKWGMSRSSLFGLAVSRLLDQPGAILLTETAAGLAKRRK
jgi:predicted RNase H-like HicB family nuclease